MGPFAFFRNRRERESATAQVGGTEITVDGGTASGGWSLSADADDSGGGGGGGPVGSPAPAAGPDFTGAEGFGRLLTMVGQAIQSGSIQVQRGEGEMVDLSDHDAIREQLAAHTETQPDLDGDGKPS